ncbi:unnamed protein product [Pylaiella littoralis]
MDRFLKMNVSVLVASACMLYVLGSFSSFSSFSSAHGFQHGPVSRQSPLSDSGLKKQQQQQPCRQSVGKRRAERATALEAVDEQQNNNIKTGTAGWAQRTITVTAPSRGCHLITSEISKQVPELRSFKVGMANIFLKHTSASLTINENADPDVRTDMESALNQIVPVKWHNTMFRHTLEGPDDMTGHVKSTIVGASLNIPVSNGCLALGTWQGVYLCEHRDTGGWGGGFARDIVITVQGITSSD